MASGFKRLAVKIPAQVIRVLTDKDIRAFREGAILSPVFQGLL
jgi:hypothetical protein